MAPTLCAISRDRLLEDEAIEMPGGTHLSGSVRAELARFLAPPADLPAWNRDWLNVPRCSSPHCRALPLYAAIYEVTTSRRRSLSGTRIRSLCRDCAATTPAKHNLGLPAPAISETEIAELAALLAQADAAAAARRAERSRP